jgi:hypothetical protein
VSAATAAQAPPAGGSTQVAPEPPGHFFGGLRYGPEAIKPPWHVVAFQHRCFPLCVLVSSVTFATNRAVVLFFVLEEETMETKRKGIWCRCWPLPCWLPAEAGSESRLWRSHQRQGGGGQSGRQWHLWPQFTVQGAAPPGRVPCNLAERVASSYGVTLCPRYIFTGSSFNQAAGCTNHAIGGGRISNFTAPHRRCPSHSSSPTPVRWVMGR